MTLSILNSPSVQLPQNVKKKAYGELHTDIKKAQKDKWKIIF